MINSYTKISRTIISNKAKRFAKMLRTLLRWMNIELNNYVELTNEIPWFYNERAILGFLISGLAGIVILSFYKNLLALKTGDELKSDRADQIYIFTLGTKIIY